MEDAPVRRAVIAFVIACVAVPLVVMIWQPMWGSLMLGVGILVAARGWYFHVRMARLGARGQHSRAHVKSNQANIIYVQVVDDLGNDLLPEVARAKLEAAQMEAGPRDTVLPVRRKL